MVFLFFYVLFIDSEYLEKQYAVPLSSSKQLKTKTILKKPLSSHSLRNGEEIKYDTEVKLEEPPPSVDPLNKTFVTAVGSVSSTPLPPDTNENLENINEERVSRGDSIFSEIESNLKSANEEEARVRKELEDYMNAIRSKRTDDGNNLVDFPSNYNDIVNMMTKNDVYIYKYNYLYII